MADGTIKNVEDVKVGDKVQSLNRVNNVVALHDGVSNGYRIVPKVGEPFVISSNHILTLKVAKEVWDKNRGKRGQMVTNGQFDLVDVSIEEFLTWSEHKRKNARLFRPAINYSSKEQTIPPYILGSWLGDGTSREVSLTNIDEEIIKEWKNYAEEMGMSLSRRQDGDTFAIINKSGNLNPVKKLFNDLNLLNNKHIPLNYLTGSREQRLELLAGILDTDGHYSTHNNSFEITFKSRELLEQTAQLCRGLGFKVGKIQTKHNNTYNKDYYRIVISGNVKDIPTRVLRKQSTKDGKQNEVLTGFNVEPIDRVEYYGFQTDGDHRYLLWDNTLTHNTWVLEKMVTSVWEQGFNVGFISPEMGANSIGYRFDTLHKNFSNRNLMWGEALENEKDYKNYLKELEKKDNKFVVATPLDFNNNVTVSKLRTWIKQNNLDLLAIDGITYINDERGKNRDNKTTSLTNISEDLMSLSVEMKIPILAVVQANRSGVAEEGSNDTPELESIRDSDGMAMNASKVLSIRQRDGVLNIGVKKQRNGVVGSTIKYLWNIDKGEFVWVPSEDSAVSKETVETKIQENNDIYLGDITDIF